MSVSGSLFKCYNKGILSSLYTTRAVLKLDD